ncbi:hypothetical protein SEA_PHRAPPUCCINO_68 [Mycobacterium phage Phrappuccino]|uniref:Uncharacterized protein n=1 Tax=Mycobacterium phage Phrappuccino TaxID=2591223 RepID=A0A514DDP4_9CAUD|nr:hypothetical protein KHQ87_gp068 [Mycobacterium phage Phrappuccino]QDH91743.1 hypothetical protein SEA_PHRAPPUCCINO_68 [Mycobacterium phage Phrappuccino]QIQ63344.1 hypothetical protein SEA_SETTECANDELA_68 [Mycobacterium phage Settecandela]
MTAILKQAEQYSWRVAMPWYHVSPHDLPDATRLTPGGGESAFGDEVYQDEFSDHPNHVWMWNDLNSAVRFLPEIGAEKRPNGDWEHGHVYEVDPEDPRPWYSGQHGYVTPSAKIIRQVPQGEWGQQ